MAPKPQNETEIKFDRIEKHDGETVVISGISGLYPNCKNVKEFGEVLYNKVNPISPENARWLSDYPEASRYTGTVPEVDRFDAQFFKVNYRLSSTMDPMSRKILEQCYQALYDSGVNLETINGKRVAVFVGTCFSEAEKASFYVAEARTGTGIVGCNKSMFANRISYWLNLKGPSMAIDESCCSSAGALTQAYQAMSRGDCEAAIVAGCNLYLHTQSTIHTGRIIENAPDCKTKCFDQKADGSAKSEAIQVVFLQKAKDALRIYAELIYIKNEYVNANNNGTGVGFYRDPTLMTNFLKNFYNHVNISPDAIEYVEAMGAAIPDVDKAELEAISNVFCNDRSNPLLVGSVMSNIGYTEASSGLCAVVKALIAYQTGKIPANLHLNNPRKDIPALLDGRMSVVTDTEPFRRGYVAINNHSITGCSAHILLNGRYKPKDFSRYKSSIPHLVTISARQQSSVQTIFDDLKSRPVDPEELALFHNIHQTNITGHLGRGFIILDTDKDQKTVSLVEKSEYFDKARRPLWFVYSGMGSQWPGMGTQLMRITTFAAAIDRCQRALEHKGIDLVHILTSTDKHIFDNILHSFVGIAAVQIGLTDVLRELGLVPDKIIGHSVGELGCAYADGCFTAEEMILSAYSRGLVSVQTPFIRGSMAAVGIAYQEIKKMLPPEIEVACHNSAASSTISGPADLMKEFVASLVAKGIFAKEVPCSNIAYHSRYIAEAGPKLLEMLSEVIEEPKERSDRWISTSIPKEEWDQPIAKTSSAEYHTNNLLNPVLFQEASTLIPADAILVEIAPHGLLQAILKRALPDSCKHIPLTRRGHPDNALMVLEGIGTLYTEGYNPKISALYPQVEFPVSTETPMLSHLVEWAHNEKWNLPLYVAARRRTAAAANYIICLRDPEHAYLEGHVVQGKNGCPVAAVLVAVWKTLAMYMQKPKEELSVTFHDVQFFTEPNMSDRQLKISVSIHKGQGHFEVLEGNSKVATGVVEQTIFEKDYTNTQTETKQMTFNCKDIYQILYDRGYAYRNAFCSIHAANESFTDAQLRWDDNWVTLIDGMIQMNVLRLKHHAVSKPLRIRKIVINTIEHYLMIAATSEDQVLLNAYVDDLVNTTRCGGVFMDSIQFHNLPQSSTEVTDIKTLQFVPHFNLPSTDLKTSIQVSLQIVAENVNKNLLDVVEIVNTAGKLHSFHAVEGNYVPGLEINYRQLNKKELLKKDLAKVDLVLVQSLSTDDNLCKHLHSVLKKNALILSAEEITQNTRARPSSLYKVVASQSAGDIVMNLLKWRPCSQSSATAITVRTQSDLSMLLTTRNCLGPSQKLLVLTSYPPVSYTKELVEKWRKESERNEIYLVMINHSKTEDEGMFEIPELELAVNILNEGVWGGKYYMPIRNEPSPYVTLRSKNIGDLKSLSWIEVPEPNASGIPVMVRYAALNTEDFMKAAGLYMVKEGNDVDDISYGMDFSGVTESGVRVMGLVESGAASNWVTAHRELLWPVPKDWTLEDAATVPMPYAMAFYCLAIRCRMLSNTSILVHGGAGALGQAVISIALAHGLQVFTTVSDVRKKHFLRKLFPDIKDDHIGNSRDFSFRDLVLTATKGRGVTYVVNCLKGEFKDVSITCAGTSSIVIDTSQIHSGECYSYQFKNLSKEGCYMRVDFSSIFNNKIEKLKLQYLISEGITRGYVRPLTRVTYATTEVSRAFRLLEASQHRGRVLLALSETPKGQPRIACSPNQTQIVICNDQTFGVHVADRLVKRGARKLLLQLPTLTPQVLYKKRLWQEFGVAVNMYNTSNLNTEKNIKEMLITGTKMGAVEGIYIIATQSNNDIKRDTLETLDLISRKLCPSLKNYVVVSNDDKFGNKLCLSRVQQQLPANKICLPSIKMMDEVKLEPSKEGISSWVACDALESALRSKQTITIVQVQKAKTISILHNIARISDTKLPEIINEDDTLMNLGISIDKVQSIAALLQKEYNYALMKEQILELSVKQIRALEQVFSGKEMTEIEGLKMFFTHFDSDELTSTTDIMSLPTLFDQAMLREYDFDITQSYLCIIPGLEGHYERFRILCERLKMPAIVVQPALEESGGSIKQLAVRNAQLLLKKINIKDNFYLLGYESGALVALETAAILEEHGLIGTVYLIGAPADQFKVFLKKEIDRYGTDKELQKAVLRHMYELMSNTELSLKLDEDLEWNELVEICTRDLLNHMPLSAEYARLNLKMPVYRIKQVLEYKPEIPTLQSKLVLLQPKDLSGEEIPAALQKLTKQSLAAHKLTLPLAQALEDLQSATFINQHLDDTILKKFNTENLCVTYLLHPGTLMTFDDDDIDVKNN